MIYLKLVNIFFSWKLPLHCGISVGGKDTFRTSLGNESEVKMEEETCVVSSPVFSGRVLCLILPASRLIWLALTPFSKLCCLRSQRLLTVCLSPASLGHGPAFTAIPPSQTLSLDVFLGPPLSQSFAIRTPTSSTATASESPEIAAPGPPSRGESTAFLGFEC